MKRTHLHAALRSLALEYRLADRVPDGLYDTVEFGEIDAIMHEIAHGLMIVGGIADSELIATQFDYMSDGDADAHELTALRVVLRTLDRLGQQFVRPAQWLKFAAFRGSPPTLHALLVVLSPAERGVVSWLESIIRARAVRIHDASAGIDGVRERGFAKPRAVQRLPRELMPGSREPLDDNSEA